MAQGQPGPAAKTQIVAAFFHPLAHGLDAVRPETSGLEARVAAGNQQQRGASGRVFSHMGGCLRSVRGVAAVRLA